MNESFAKFLAVSAADAETVQQAARYYLAERTGDLEPDDMREQMVRAAEDQGVLEATLESLRHDPRTLENACLALLSMAWEEPGEAEKIRGAVDEAKKKLPVIELGILAMVAMYGMYLIATDGVKETEIIVQRDEHGRVTTIERTKFHSPAGPLAAVAKLLIPWSGAKKHKSAE